MGLLDDYRWMLVIWKDIIIFEVKRCVIVYRGCSIHILTKRVVLEERFNMSKLKN